MRIQRSLLSLGFAALLIAVPALAADKPAEHAPADQYTPFDKNSKIISDQKTKIEWDRAVTKQPFAVLNAACLGSPVSGARVPTVKELLTIVDEEPHLEYEFGKEQVKLIDQSAFPSTPVDLPHWTQTPGSDPVNTVLGVDFKTGLIVEMQTASAQGYVRCMK